MVGQKMPFFNAALLLLGQSSEHLAKIFAKAPIQHLAPTLGDKNNVPSRGDPVNCRLSLAVSAVSSFVPV
jgi:hypothetical protein